MRRAKAKQSPNLLTMEMITREAVRTLEDSRRFMDELRNAKDETEVRRLQEESKAKAEYWRRVGAQKIAFPRYRPQFGEYRELLELDDIARLK